jgi:uncharacterized protein (TIGR02646 family)
MRRVIRTALPKAVLCYLDKRQSMTNMRLALGELDIQSEWKAARQTIAVKKILKTLQQMMGLRERCMYCVDSYGCDIEHFYPKVNFPERAFQWLNLLLCCAYCGRLKGSQFPLSNGQPLLIDPSAEDPWLHLEFDPVTGQLAARFDLLINDWSPKGLKTVEVLQLDRREVLESVYRATFNRLCGIVLTRLSNNVIAMPAFSVELQEADDHGLLSWCFGANGMNFAPFDGLHQKHPEVWTQCRRVFCAALD